MLFWENWDNLKKGFVDKTVLISGSQGHFYSHPGGKIGKKKKQLFLGRKIK